MTINIEMLEILDDIMIEKTAQMSSDDLNNQSDNIELQTALFRKKISELSTHFKKATLIQAKLDLKSARAKKTAFNIEQFLNKAQKDAKGVLIELFMQNKLPDGLTLAFREGKEITDNEAKHILADLITMGVIYSDERKD